MAESLFADQTPVNLEQFDAAALVVGCTFKSSVDGTISALRWYAPDRAVGGSPVATLWTQGAPGTELATATFGALTLNAWNQVAITPVAITANTPYVVSVWSPDYYTFTGGVFTAPVTVGHLTAYQNGSPYGNGVFKEPAVSTDYPDSASGSATNYFADVVFTPAGTVPNSAGGVRHGTKTHPLAGDVVVSAGPLTAGRYRIRAVTRGSGTLTSADLDNVQLLNDAGTISTLSMTAGGGLTTNPELVANVAAGGTVSVVAAGDSSGTAAVYGALLAVIPEALFP